MRINTQNLQHTMPSVCDWPIRWQLLL